MDKRSAAAKRAPHAGGAQTAPRTDRQARAKSAARRRKQRRRAVRRELLLWAATLAVTVLVALVIRTFVFEIVRVEGPSMEPTLTSGELLLVTKLDCLIGEPARGDVVVCRYPNREGTFIKRVIGMPGDTVVITDGRTYVNDRMLDESFVSYPAAADYGPVLVGSGQYMVMGDNRAISHDSRSDDVGTLSDDYIVGRVRSVIYPFGDARSVGA